MAKISTGFSKRASFSSVLFIAFFVPLLAKFGSTHPLAGQERNIMALDKFLGSWVEEKKEGFRLLANALALSNEQKAFFENSKSELSYSRNGDTWSIQVGIVGVPQKSTFTFKLGEYYNSQNIDGSPLRSVIRQDGDRLVERHESTGERKFFMDIVRMTNGETMNATTTIGDVAMNTIYRRS